MRVSLIQINANDNRKDNLKAILDLCPEETDFILTPECSNIMGYQPARHELFTMHDDEFVKGVQQHAQSKGRWVLLGSVLVKDEKTQNPVNRQILLSPLGEIHAYYDKIHMFDVELENGEHYHESARFLAGGEAVVSQVDHLMIGHSICFDLRFPQLYQELAEMGAQIMVVPAAFTEATGRAHWEALLRARAIENGAYILAPAQCGSYPFLDNETRETWGHSMIISPWGEILAELDQKPGVITLDIDHESVLRARKQIPILQLKKPFERRIHGK